MKAMGVREAIEAELDQMDEAELAEVHQLIQKKRDNGIDKQTEKRALLARIAERRKNGPTFSADEIDAAIRANRP